MISWSLSLSLRVSEAARGKVFLYSKPCFLSVLFLFACQVRAHYVVIKKVRNWAKNQRWGGQDGIRWDGVSVPPARHEAGPSPVVPVEVALLAVGEMVGHDQLVCASRMNNSCDGVCEGWAVCTCVGGEWGSYWGNVCSGVSAITQSNRVRCPQFILIEVLEREYGGLESLPAGLKQCLWATRTIN